jgi:Rad3-related DNA helicase
MSATLVSVDELVDSLGVDRWEVQEEGDEDARREDGLTGGGPAIVTRPARWDEVHVPAVFPVENRQIVASGIADMTRKGQDKGGLEDLLGGIGIVTRAHNGENILIHTHTYAIAKEVEKYLSQIIDQPLWTYTSSRDRNEGLENFKQHGGVLIAPSMDRGIDLPGDLCRVQIICKMPNPYLGDAQVSARLKTRGGELWYSAQAARGLIQMTGRAVRSESDWATTYILDATFGKWKRRNKALLPGWWQEGVTYVPPNRFAAEVAKRSQQHKER